MPALPPYIIEPIFEQFCALLPEREVDHPLGCHRRRVPDRVRFEKLIAVLVFGCAYWRIADGTCSATTIRRRRDEWIEARAMEALEENRWSMEELLTYPVPPAELSKWRGRKPKWLLEVEHAA